MASHLATPLVCAMASQSIRYATDGYASPFKFLIDLIAHGLEMLRR